MLDYLRHIRVFLYTGTQPASYTLGLIEAMLSGTPVVSIGPAGMWMPALFEAHEITKAWANDAEDAKAALQKMLQDDGYAQAISEEMRMRAIDLFGIENIAPQWAAFLAPVRKVHPIDAIHPDRLAQMRVTA